MDVESKAMYLSWESQTQIMQTPSNLAHAVCPCNQLVYTGIGSKNRMKCQRVIQKPMSKLIWYAKHKYSITEFLTKISSPSFNTEWRSAKRMCTTKQEVHNTDFLYSSKFLPRNHCPLFTMFSILKGLAIHFKVVERGDITLQFIVLKFCNTSPYSLLHRLHFALTSFRDSEELIMLMNYSKN